jgi:hypothetical protein
MNPRNPYTNVLGRFNKQLSPTELLASLLLVSSLGNAGQRRIRMEER